MKRSLICLLALLCCASANAQRAASGPAPAAPIVHGDLRVDADWIRLPHRSAARLLAETRTAKDMPALREKVVKLVARGEATRVDLSSSTLMDESRQRVENAVVLPYPDHYQPGAQAFFIWPDGRKTPGEQLPAMAEGFRNEKLGRTLEAEIDMALEKGQVAYDLFLDFNGHVKDRSWGGFPHHRTWPIIFSQQVQTRMARVQDEWQLAGMLTPQPADETGPVQHHADRLLIFARLAGSGARPRVPVPDNSCFIHVEWIEMDLSLASRLLTAHPAIEHAGALRHELAAELSNGSAVLVESTAAFVISGERSVVKSHLSLPFCYRDNQETIMKGEAGTLMECEMNMDPNRQHVDVNISAALKGVHYTGALSQWQYPEAVRTERSAVGQLNLRSGQPALLATLDPLPGGANSEVPFRPTRKLFVFVRAIF